MATKRNKSKLEAYETMLSAIAELRKYRKVYELSERFPSYDKVCKEVFLNYAKRIHAEDLREELQPATEKQTAFINYLLSGSIFSEERDALNGVKLNRYQASELISFLKDYKGLITWKYATGNDFVEMDAKFSQMINIYKS